MLRRYVANRTQDPIVLFGFEQFDHTPYSSDLALSGYHVFLKLKKHFESQRHDNDDVNNLTELQRLLNQAVNVYNDSSQKLVVGYA